MTRRIMTVFPFGQWQGKPMAWRVSCAALCSRSLPAKPAPASSARPKASEQRAGQKTIVEGSGEGRSASDIMSVNTLRASSGSVPFRRQVS